MVLVGGGLQNGLIALAALRAQPRLRVCLVEREPAIGGNHTWCFHAGDIPPALAGVVASITTHRWDGYDVRFPDRARGIDEPYAGTCSPALAEAVRDEFARASGRAELRCGVAARTVGPTHVELDTGEALTAELVVDARGPEVYDDEGAAAGARPPTAGYQKFVGVELELARPHELARPLLMDATVPQRGGFRFFYVLPLARDLVLVEDTTLSRDPELEVERGVRDCLAFAAARDLRIERVVRTERGVLAMPWTSRGVAPPSAPLRAGYQGGWFHPATGYSFPVAARLAAFIARRPPAAVIGPELRALWRRHMRQLRFAHRLNWLLFHWFAERDAWRVFARFYRLPVASIRRFYALETNAADRARILLGRPPRGLSLRARWRARSAP